MNKLIDELKKAELEKIRSRIYNLQKDIDNIYKDEKEEIYKFNLVNESCTYLRFLITSFKVDLFNSLKNIDSKDPLCLNLYNIHLLHYVPPGHGGKLRDFGMRFYLTCDQIKRINKVFGRNNKEKSLRFRTDMYATGNKCGLARLSMLLAHRKENNDNADIFVWENWPRHLIYHDPQTIGINSEAYVGLDEELKIYGIKEDQKSTMVVGVIPNGIEIFLIFDNKPSPKVIGEVTRILKFGLENLLEIFSEKWELIFFDQLLWEFINKEKNDYSENLLNIWNNVEIGLNKKNYFEYIKNNGEEAFNNFSQKHIELWHDFQSDVIEIRDIKEGSLWENLNMVDDEYDRYSELRQWGSNFAINLNWLKKKVAGSEPYIKNTDRFRRDLWLSTNRFTDLGLDYMASHDMSHINNLCSLAIPILNALRTKKIPNKHLLNFINSIYLHDLGMGTYFSEIKKSFLVTEVINNEKSTNLENTRAYHSLLSCVELYEKNNYIWRLTEEELKITSILCAYHIRKTPLLKSDDNIFVYKDQFSLFDFLFNVNEDSKIYSLEETKNGDNSFPYFLLVSLLRIIDSIDIQEERSSKLGLTKLECILSLIEQQNQIPFLKKQPIHILKHAAIMNHKLKIEQDKFEIEILYGPEFFMPLAIVVHGFASAIDEIYDELDKINRPAVIKEINNELSSLNLSKQLDNGGIKIAFDLFGYYGTIDEEILKKWNELYE